MTNPNNALGTNSAYSGRTTPEAFNDVLAAFSGRGILSGWNIMPNSNMTIAVGGNGDTRDVAIAEDNLGNKTTVNNISGAPIIVTLPEAPESNSRIDLLVAYVNNPPYGSPRHKDNYEAVGLIVVSGEASSSPTIPNNTAIRAAIVADGALGDAAYYVILGQILVSSDTTAVISDMITQGTRAMIRNSSLDITIDSALSSSSMNAVQNKVIDAEFEKVPYLGQTLSTPTSVAYVATENIQDGAVTADKASFTTQSTEEQVVGKWIDGRTIYRKIISYTATTTIGNDNDQTNIQIPHGISNLSKIINIKICDDSDTIYPVAKGGSTTCINYYTNTWINFSIVNMTLFPRTFYYTLEYIKTS